MPRVPPNCEFEIDDLEDIWKHKPFSYIHIRSLAGSLKDWPKLFTQAYTNLEPGGWIENVDFEVWIRDQTDQGSDAPGKLLERGEMLNMWMKELGRAGEMM